MTIRQLEYFCATAEEGSVSAAARKLHVAQPPISRQIALLEEEFGTALFRRGNKGMKPHWSALSRRWGRSRRRGSWG